MILCESFGLTQILRLTVSKPVHFFFFCRDKNLNFFGQLFKDNGNKALEGYKKKFLF